MLSSNNFFGSSISEKNIAQSNNNNQSYKNSIQLEQAQSYFNNSISNQKNIATYITHNLVWNIDIDKTLQFAKENEASLLFKVQIKDYHGQRYYNTPLKILLSLGERNPFKCKQGEDFGLVERLAACFDHPDDVYEQYEEWKKESELATAITMAPYKTAINDLCTDIIESKEIKNDTTLQELFNLPIAQKFRDALKPNPDHVVTAGFSWDFPQIISYFYDVLKDKRMELGNLNSLKSNLFEDIVYHALQARMSRGDLCILENGISKTVVLQRMPKRFNYLNGIPEKFKNIGNYCFGMCGSDRGYAANCKRLSWEDQVKEQLAFDVLYPTKIASLELPFLSKHLLRYDRWDDNIELKNNSTNIINQPLKENISKLEIQNTKLESDSAKEPCSIPVKAIIDQQQCKKANNQP